jgi:hypothetical protein
VIAIRVEKLRFLTEEMHLAFHLATHVPDPFSARTLARHILVRAENFNAHARGLRRPLNLAGHDTWEFHNKKEIYATNFEEYFKVARHRLGAHVQDFDFGKRIELWNDIEVVKISFFVDGAKEIYQSLAPIALTGYVPYSDPPELTDAGLNQVLLDFQRSKHNEHWTEIGTDPLAMTRENTTAMLNMTPVHARAGQLALIRRWIRLQTSLLEKFSAHTRVARILKARIVTDIVSFCDCLVTRSVPAGAPQETEGLDKLIAANGQSSAPIGNFVEASNFDSELQAARSIRDEIGAHLEIDDARTLGSLVANLDNYDLERAHAFYQLVGNTFDKVCSSILYLRLYAADGARLYGVTASRQPSVPFSGDAVPPTAVTRPPINDEEAYLQNLRPWLDGDDDQSGAARQFFWQAFGGSDVVEEIEEIETFGASSRYHRHEFRKAHRFIASMLAEGLSDSDFAGELDLIVSCGRGSPYPLAELLVRYGATASTFRQWLICYALGEIRSHPHVSATEFLKARTTANEWGMRFQATLALYKTFVQSEGIYRINNQGKTNIEYDAFVDLLTSSMNPPKLLLCSLAFASILRGRGVGAFARPFAADYSALQDQIERLCLPYLKDDATLTKATTLKQLIKTDDYVGVCVLLAVDLQSDDRWKNLRDALLEACCNGSIVTAANDQASRHLAMCFVLKGDQARALQIAKGLAGRNPDWTEVQILVARILADTPGAEDEASRKIADIRRSYKLDTAKQADLAACEEEIEKRKASPE